MTERNEAMDLINQARAQARSDGFKRFFVRNVKNLSRLAVVALIAAIGYCVFSYYQKSQQEKFSVMLHQSLIDQQLGEIEKAKEVLRQISNSSAPSGVKSLAELRYAALLLEEGKKEEAAKLYAEVSDCGGCEDYIRELGGLLLVKVWISSDAEIAKEDLSARIEKIEKSSKLLRYYITEQRALLEMEKNNLEKSYQIFEMIAKNPEASEGLKSRANDGLKMLIAKGYEPAEKTKLTSETEIKSEEKAAAPESK